MVISQIIWYFSIRFKQVELQVVLDDQETTYRMFQKLKYLKWYNIIFTSSNLVFQGAIFIKWAFNKASEVVDM